MELTSYAVHASRGCHCGRRASALENTVPSSYTVLLPTFPISPRSPLKEIEIKNGFHSRCPRMGVDPKEYFLHEEEEWSIQALGCHRL